MTYGQKWNKGKKLYRKAFGHRSPYTRVYGHRNPGQALDVTMDNVRKIKSKLKGIKERLNVEKKHVDEVHTESMAVAQVYANSATNVVSGHTSIDITPAIAQGHGSDDRNGNSIKFTGLNMKISLIGQANCHSSRRVRFTVVRVGCAGEPHGTTFLKLFDKNPLSSSATQPVYDLQAPMNYTTLKTMGIKVLARRTFYLPAQTAYHKDTEQHNETKSHKTCSFSIKLQDVARYSGDSSTEPENFRYYMFLQSDCGNSGTPDITGRADLPVTIGNSGVVCRYHSRIWYVDN